MNCQSKLSGKEIAANQVNTEVSEDPIELLINDDKRKIVFSGTPSRDEVVEMNADIARNSIHMDQSLLSEEHSQLSSVLMLPPTTLMNQITLGQNQINVRKFTDHFDATSEGEQVNTNLSTLDKSEAGHFGKKVSTKASSKK